MTPKEIIETIKKNIENSIKEDEELYGTSIDYILINPDNNDTISIISDGAEKIVEFTPYTKKMETGYATVSEWAYNFDEYLFQELENGYMIGYMSDNNHYGVWNSIQELYPEDINHKDGVQWYLQYCADNGITKEYLDKQTGLDTPNVMKFFDGLALFETMEYKGYIIEADDTNLDNWKENLVNIYENKEVFDNKEPIETVSLNTIDLKQNIREYIDEFYIDKKVIDKEISYYTFVIGYDLLQEDFKTSPYPECDLTYGFCEKVAKDFVNSDSYKYDNRSSYELLEKYINENRFQILKDYEKFIGAENIYFEDNKKILKVANRNDQPVALVEWVKGGRKEYVVAINYTIDGNKIYWSRGYYYTDNDKAKIDFNRVKNGEYLTPKYDEREAR